MIINIYIYIYIYIYTFINHRIDGIIFASTKPKIKSSYSYVLGEYRLNLNLDIGCLSTVLTSLPHRAKTT